MNMDTNNIAWIRVNGKFRWFVCDEFGRGHCGPTDVFDTLEECIKHSEEHYMEHRSKLVITPEEIDKYVAGKRK